MMPHIELLKWVISFCMPSGDVLELNDVLYTPSLIKTFFWF